MSTTSSVPAGHVSPGNIDCDTVAKLVTPIVSNTLLKGIRSKLKLGGIVRKQAFACGEELLLPYISSTREPKKKIKNKPIEVTDAEMECKRITLDCHIYDAVLIEDQARLLNCGSDSSFIMELCDSMMDGIARYIDKKISMAYLQACTVMNLKGIGIDRDAFIEMHRILSHMLAPMDLVGCFGIDSYHKMLEDPTFLQASLRKCEGFDLLREGTFDRIMGIDIAQNYNTPVVDGCEQNMVFNPNAIVLSTMDTNRATTIPTKWGNVNANMAGVYTRSVNQFGLQMRYMMHYSPRHFGWLISLDTMFGVDVLYPEWIINVICDSIGVDKPAPIA